MVRITAKPVDPPAPTSPTQPKPPPPPKLDAYAPGAAAKRTLASPLEPKVPSGVTYGPSRGPLFPRVAPSVLDVKQGARLGDCWFIAALASLTYARPSALRDMVRVAGPELYDVRFFHDGKEEWVRVTTAIPRLPDGSMPFAPMQHERWLPIIEKAFARFAEQHFGREGYEALQGGHASRAITALTGHDVRINDTAMIHTLAQANEGKVVVVHSSANAQLLVPSHGYSVLGVRDGNVLLRNPWGDDPLGGVHGVITLPLDQLRGEVSLALAEEANVSLRLSF